jgi:hypothetical protein
MADISRMILRISLCRLWCISSEELQLLNCESDMGIGLQMRTQSIRAICLEKRKR